MLTAYEIDYSDGTTERTNMAAGVTLEQARKYFIGARFVREDFETGEEFARTAIDVREIKPAMDN